MHPNALMREKSIHKHFIKLTKGVILTQLLILSKCLYTYIQDLSEVNYKKIGAYLGQLAGCSVAPYLFQSMGCKKKRDANNNHC